MNRGSIIAFETLLIFLGWMVLLTLAWEQSSIHVNEMVAKWNMQRIEEKALAQSDAFLLQHHVNPWNGCAHFDEAKRRSLPYVIEKECLEKLSNVNPTEGIYEVAIRTNGIKKVFFETNSDEKECMVLGRPGILFPENKLIVLEVKACEKQGIHLDI